MTKKIDRELSQMFRRAFMKAKKDDTHDFVPEDLMIMDYACDLNLTLNTIRGLESKIIHSWEEGGNTDENDFVFIFEVKYGNADYQFTLTAKKEESDSTDVSFWIGPENGHAEEVKLDTGEDMDDAIEVVAGLIGWMSVGKQRDKKLKATLEGKPKNLPESFMQWPSSKVQ